MLEENPEENRIRLYFPGKPNANVRNILKANGFRWSRAAGAWQRMYNNGSKNAVERVIDLLSNKGKLTHETTPKNP